MPNNRRGGNNKKSGPIYRRARRDVRQQYRPLLQENTRAQNAAESAYGALPAELKNIYQGYTGASDRIAGNLTDQYAAYDAALPPVGFEGVTGDLAMAPNEAAAFYGATGDLHGAGLNQLASQAQRNIGYGASAQTEGGYAQRAAIDNLLQQRHQIMQNMPMDIKSRIDELREQRLTNQLARSQMESEEATSKYLMDLIGAQLNSDRRRDRRRNNNKGQGNGK